MASMAARQNVDPDFPCTLIIKTPFPTHRLASTALQALQVDAELSPLVRRKFSLVTPPSSPISTTSATSSASAATEDTPDSPDATPSSSPSPSQPPPPSTHSASGQTVLLTEYRAKTNRMLRVAVNGFMESLGVVLGVMERLDVDVLAAERQKAGADASAPLHGPARAEGMATATTSH